MPEVRDQQGRSRHELGLLRPKTPGAFEQRHLSKDGYDYAQSDERHKLPTERRRHPCPRNARLLNIKKLDFLDALTAQQSRWSGALNGELQLAGTVDMPQFQGHLELESGEVLSSGVANRGAAVGEFFC